MRKVRFSHHRKKSRKRSWKFSLMVPNKRQALYLPRIAYVLQISRALYLLMVNVPPPLTASPDP
jgi:hypothetical protein